MEKRSFYKSTPMKTMKQLTTINIENDNYHIFRVESKEGILGIYFIWGKTDFCASWYKKKNIWLKKNIQIYKKSQWYDYQKVTNHGILLEETYWKNDSSDLYIDLPKNFVEVINAIFKKVSPNYHL